MANPDLRPASLERRARTILAAIADPEIPAVSIVDLGIVDTVVSDADGHLEVHLLPTFIGCPATEIIRTNVIGALADAGLNATVSLVYDPPWSSERITSRGREQLRASGFAPPSRDSLDPQLRLSTVFVANCPYCGSANTTMENLFGPTLCRSIYHCAKCKQPFESFKQL
jgi:ring-1,2-phenylacetyl-CoA epoxidase subunit PaaD